MDRMIFINLPVTDLDRSVAFYEAVGAVKDERFCDATAAMVKFSEAINVMLLTHDKYRQFTAKPIADSHAASAMLLAISADNRAGVDGMIGAAGRAGGVVDPAPLQEYGWMYGRSFEDPDGHHWEVTWMDVEAAMAATTAAPEAVAA